MFWFCWVFFGGGMVCGFCFVVVFFGFFPSQIFFRWTLRMVFCFLVDVFESLDWDPQMAVQDGAEPYTWLYVRLFEPLTSIGDLFHLYR